MGMVSLLNSTINMMVSATSFGIPTSAVHEISENYDRAPKQLLESIKLIRSWVLLTAVLGVLVCVCLGPLSITGLLLGVIIRFITCYWHQRLD